ncbi:Arc family DNA-binding protein [Pseudomonas sp. BN415]|nr:Arc family DNA-binding protein [Pseudomonas sp. BN415]
MSRTNPQFKLRMPLALRSKAERAAKAAHRSLNAELVVRLEQSFVQEVPAHEGSQLLPAPHPRRELRLLCLLVPSRTGGQRTLPVHSLRALPPCADIQGRWALGLPAGLVLRETQARPPRPEVLARCVRQRAAHALRAHPRAVRGLSHD